MQVILRRSNDGDVTVENGVYDLYDPLPDEDTQARSVSHWSPYDRVGVVNADP
jgi:hypothetical protein